jgi:hypothetical protein
MLQACTTELDIKGYLKYGTYIDILDKINLKKYRDKFH